MEKEYKITHIIEILYDENYTLKDEDPPIVFSVKQGDAFGAMEDIENKGFLIKTAASDNLIFVPVKNVKIIQEVKPLPIFTPLYLMGFFVSNEKVVKLWVWEPSSDITSYEIARLLPFVLTAGSSQGLKEAELDLLGIDWKKHIKLEMLPPQLVNSKEYHEFIKHLR